MNVPNVKISPNAGLMGFTKATSRPNIHKSKFLGAPWRREKTPKIAMKASNGGCYQVPKNYPIIDTLWKLPVESWNSPET